jgi:uncharacterized membrane protein YphA (DoxX/SURF4 family)
MNAVSMLKALVLSIFCLGSGIILVVSGSHKLLHPQAFVDTIAIHHSVYASDMVIAAWFMILSEISVGLTIIACAVNKNVRIACLLSSFFFALLMLYAVWLVIEPPTQPVGCGCGFSREVVTADGWKWIVVRNGVLAATYAAMTLVSCRVSPAALKIRFGR